MMDKRDFGPRFPADEVVLTQRHWAKVKIVHWSEEEQEWIYEVEYKDGEREWIKETDIVV
jgi:hypothetical protein